MQEKGVRMNNEEKGMSLIVKTVTRWLKGFIFLFGAYVVVFGHLSPGGGFPGGVVFAATFILITLAFGREYALKKIGKTLASELDSLGALLFLTLAILGIYFTGVFFSNFIQKFHTGENFKLFSGGIIPLCNISISLKVGASLFMVFIILSVVRVVFEDGKGKLITSEKKDKK